MRIRKVGQSSSGNTDRYANQPAVAPKYNYLGMNSHWHIDQVNEGAVYPTVEGVVVHAMDGLVIYKAGAGAFEVSRVTDPDNASLKCCKIKVTTADTDTSQAGDEYLIQWRIPGDKIVDLSCGVAGKAKTVTLAFKASIPVLGTYGIYFHNADGNRYYVTTITVTSTDEQPYVATVQLDASGTWYYDTRVGITIGLCLYAGSTYRGATESWGGSVLFTSSAQVNFMSSTANIAYIKAGVQLVIGTVAGDAMPQSYDEALKECQRFYEKSYNPGVAVATVTYTGAIRAFALGIYDFYAGNILHFKVPKAAMPTMIFYSPTTGNVGNFRDEVALGDVGTPALIYPGVNGGYLYNSAGLLTANRAYCVHWTADCRL